MKDYRADIEEILTKLRYWIEDPENHVVYDEDKAIPEILSLIEEAVEAEHQKCVEKHGEPNLYVANFQKDST